MDVKELKAQAYDLLAQIQACQNKLHEVNNLIAQESQKPDGKAVSELPVQG